MYSKEKAPLSSSDITNADKPSSKANNSTTKNLFDFTYVENKNRLFLRNFLNCHVIILLS